jgi:Flp pilus assembly pilin Flp
MRKDFAAFLGDEAGTETLEWGLVCALLIIGSIAAIALIGPKMTQMWNDINKTMPSAPEQRALQALQAVQI